MIIRTIRESDAEQFTCQNCWIIQRLEHKQDLTSVWPGI